MEEAGEGGREESSESSRPLWLELDVFGVEDGVVVERLGRGGPVSSTSPI